MHGVTGKAGKLIGLVAAGFQQSQVFSATYTAGTVAPVDGHALLFHRLSGWVIERGQFARGFQRFTSTVIESVEVELLRVTRLKCGVALSANPCRNMRRLLLGIQNSGHRGIGLRALFPDMGFTGAMARLAGDSQFDDFGLELAGLGVPSRVAMHAVALDALAVPMAEHTFGLRGPQEHVFDRKPAFLPDVKFPGNLSEATVLAADPIGL